MQRKYAGEDSEDAECKEGPDEEESAVGVTDAAVDADTSSLHVDNGDDQRKKRHEEDDDIPRSPSGEDQRSVQPNHSDGHHSEICDASLFEAADDVIGQVKCTEKDREQRRDG